MMMPVYLLSTVWLLWMTNEAQRDRVVRLVLSFAIVAIPYGAFVLRHPEYIAGEAHAYALYDGLAANATTGQAGGQPWAAMRTRLALFYDYFNPSLLFLSGGSAVDETTKTAGVFLLPVAVLLPPGIYRVLKHGPWTARVCLIGFFTAPLAAAMAVDEGGATRRILFMLPFAAVIATYGVQQFLNARTLWMRRCGVALLAAALLQFAFFYKDYLGDYQVRAAPWFEYNVRGALEPAIDIASHDPSNPRVFISTGMNAFIPWYWTFYTLKHDQRALQDRTTFFSARSFEPESISGRGVIVAEAAMRDRITSQLPGATQIAAAPEPQSPPSFFVWRKDR
jgi:hypothetical protein